MPRYTLTYFNGRGRAEISRFILAYAGIKYEDNRIEINPANPAASDWPALKMSGRFPMGQLPILEIDGKPYCQSVAIARYLAKEAGIAGKTPLDQLIVDQYAETALDVGLKCYDVIIRLQTSEEKEIVRKKLLGIVAPTSFAFLESALKGSGGPYFMGSDVTYADLMLYVNAEVWNAFPDVKEIWEKHPNMVEHFKRISALPNIAEYLAKRPTTKL